MLPIALLNGMTFGYVDVRLNGLIDVFKNEDLGQSISRLRSCLRFWGSTSSYKTQSERRRVGFRGFLLCFYQVVS